LIDSDSRSWTRWSASAEQVRYENRSQILCYGKVVRALPCQPYWDNPAASVMRHHDVTLEGHGELP
ncbi:hypothetical protein BVRB_035570, partial [Beta vulgaris subsp. vulgaris]